MNARIPSILILAGALSAPALSSASAAPPSAVGYWASEIRVTRWNDLLDRLDSQAIVAGTYRSAVKSAMGGPTQELASDVWVYDRCAPDSAEARARGCNLLIITFAHGKVANMRFVNAPAAEIIANNVGAGHPERFAANG